MGGSSGGTEEQNADDEQETDEEQLARSDELAEDVGETLAEDPSDVLSLLAHFYRGQLQRATTWRGRLDQTSYWAVTIIAALMTWVFSAPNNPHYLLLIGMGAMVVFLVIETRRFRVYDVWRQRVRLLEQDVLAQVFDPDEDRLHADWRRRLAADLRNPAVKTTLMVAFARRLRRIYYPLLLILLAAWLVRITVFQPKETWQTTAAIFGVPGTAIVGGVGLFYLGVTALVVYGFLKRGGGEFHERESTDPWKE